MAYGEAAKRIKADFLETSEIFKVTEACISANCVQRKFPTGKSREFSFLPVRYRYSSRDMDQILHNVRSHARLDGLWRYQIYFAPQNFLQVEFG